MQWSFSTLGCPNLNLHQAMALAKKYAIKTIELRILHGSLNLAEALKAELGNFSRPSLPLPVSALDSSCLLFSPEEDNRRILLDLVPWAEALQVPYIRVFDGPHTGKLNQGIQFVNWWRDLRAKNGWQVEIMIETHDRLVTTPAIEEFQSALDDRFVAILWDSHHTWRKGGEPPLQTWQAIRHWVRHIHFKDSLSTPGSALPYTFTLPGRGEMPLNALFRQLQTDGFTGPVSLEWEKYWYPEQNMPPLEHALRQCREMGWW